MSLEERIKQQIEDFRDNPNKELEQLQVVMAQCEENGYYVAYAHLHHRLKLIKNVVEGKYDEAPIGFDSVSPVAPGARAIMRAQPQALFRGQRLIVPTSIARHFVINDIRVGRNSQFVAAGSVPAETFSEDAYGVRLKMDTCQISQEIFLEVTNISDEPHRFLASIVGKMSWDGSGFDEEIKPETML